MRIIIIVGGQNDRVLYLFRHQLEVYSVNQRSLKWDVVRNSLKNGIRPPNAIVPFK